MFVTVIRFVGKSVIKWTFFKLTDSILFELHDKSSPFNSTRYIVLYPQNGDRIVTIDSVYTIIPTYPRLISTGDTRPKTDSNPNSNITCLNN